MFGSAHTPTFHAMRLVGTGALHIYMSDAGSEEIGGITIDEAGYVLSSWLDPRYRNRSYGIALYAVAMKLCCAKLKTNLKSDRQGTTSSSAMRVWEHFMFAGLATYNGVGDVANNVRNLYEAVPCSTFRKRVA